MNQLSYLHAGIGSSNNRLDQVHSSAAADMKSEMAKGIEVIDVRKLIEFSISHVKDAMFLPLTDMPSNLRHLDKTKPYLVHCGGGYRSMTAISLMKREGFNDLKNIYGGFGAIQNAGVDVVVGES